MNQNQYDYLYDKWRNGEDPNSFSPDDIPEDYDWVYDYSEKDWYNIFEEDWYDPFGEQD